MGYISHHIFEDRLYLLPGAEEEFQNIFRREGDLKGASIRSYSAPVGWILSLLGLASKVRIDNRSVYINNKSFVKYIIRDSKLPDLLPLEATMQRLNRIFMEFQRNGYNLDEKAEIDRLTSNFQRMLSEDRNKDLYDILRALKPRARGVSF